jgi:hypothetical protein
VCVNSILPHIPMFSLSFLFFRYVHQNSICFSYFPMCKICLILLIILNRNIRILFVSEYKLHLQRSSLCNFVLSPINKSSDIKRKANDILHRMVECILWVRYSLNYFINTNVILCVCVCVCVCSLRIHFKGFSSSAWSVVYLKMS